MGELLSRRRRRHHRHGRHMEIPVDILAMELHSEFFISFGVQMKDTPDRINKSHLHTQHVRTDAHQYKNLPSMFPSPGLKARFEHLAIHCGSSSLLFSMALASTSGQPVDRKVGNRPFKVLPQQIIKLIFGRSMPG